MKLTFKEIIKKVLAGWAMELRQYASEFYSSTSFGIRLTIIVFYLLLLIGGVYIKFFCNVALVFRWLYWIVGLVLILLASHYLTAGQKVALTLIWILFLAVLIQKSFLILIAAYAYLRYFAPHIINKDKDKGSGPGNSDSSDKPDSSSKVD